MRPLAIDFVRQGRAFSRLGLAMLLVGGVLAVWSVQELAARDEQLAAAQWQRDSLQRRLHGAPKDAGRDDAQTQGLLAGAARVARQLQQPWDRLLADIEASVDESIALLALEPDPQKHQVRLSAEAKTLADALAFVARLEATNSLVNAHLAQQEARLSDGVQVVGFTVLAEWPEKAP